MAPKARFQRARLVLAFLVTASSAGSDLGRAHPGQWSPAFDMRPTWAPQPTAVHLMLLRGDGAPYHSRVVWLKGRHLTSWYGGEWGWTPPAAANCASWPGANFVRLDLGDPQANIFCAGHVQMGDGRTLVVGGTEADNERGMRFAKLLTPGSGTLPSAWTTPDSMHFKRWYPTATLLRDGHRAVVATDTSYGHMQLWGGRTDGEAAPTNDSLLRMAVVAGGGWDSSVHPTAGPAGRPDPRAGHSVSHAEGFGADFYFGGRSSNRWWNDAWRLYRVDNAATATQTDFGYTWQGANPSGTRPDHRAEHSSVVMHKSSLLIFGGRGPAGASGHQVFGDAWRLWAEYPQPNQELWQWQALTFTGSGTPPAARFGHTAIWEAANNRMLVFGGVGDTASNPSDNNVYALTILPGSQNQGEWSMPQFLDEVRPPARFDHAMSFDPVVRPDPHMPCCHGRVAYVSGGKTSQSAFADGTIWGLWSYTHGPHAGSLRWRAYTPAAGLAPSPRAEHTMELEAGTFVNLMFGGTNAAESQDDTLWAIDMSKTAGNDPPKWRPFARKGYTLSNHAGVRGGAVYSRIPEIFKENPSGDDWSDLSSSTLKQDWYGFNFLVPGAGGDSSRIFAAGPDAVTRYLTVAPGGASATPWRRLNDGSDDPTRHAQMWGSAVQYEPGRIMRCGRRDTHGPLGTDTTCVINLNVASPQWISSADMTHARVYHNLVMLPTGQVLVTGGMGTVQNDQAIDPRQTPEIWDPTASSGVGAWYGGAGAHALATDPIRRGYHSTAILLPDGRVLCAGGNHHDSLFTDVRMANLYCPPYLFKPDGGPATRPVIFGNYVNGQCTTTPCGSALETTSWGETFSLCVSNALDIEKVAMIRPASTTHGFDQNQRYVPLSFTKAYNPDRVVVTSPVSSAHAPPGDYMLFIIGSADSDSVPSVAKWIRIEARDPSDMAAPVVEDFLPEVASTNWVLVSWTAPADDGSDPQSGKVRELLLRYSTGGWVVDTTWDAAARVCEVPSPAPPGTFQDKKVTGLSCCTWYHFQLRALDDKPQLSGFVTSDRIRTLCPLGCGGASARESREETAAVVADGSGGSTEGGLPGSIICETSRGANGRWLVSLRMEEPGLAEPGLQLESRSADGAWVTRDVLDDASGPFALCGLRPGGRIRLNGHYRLDRIATAVSQRGGITLASAFHSRLGEVTAVVRGVGLAPLRHGDTLRLDYAPDSAAIGSGESWFVVIRHSEAAEFNARPAQGSPDASLPIRFALHQNQPNPFRSTTTIRFDVPRVSAVRLEIFDLMGRRIRTLARRDFAAGFHALEWDHCDSEGRLVSPGVYVYRLMAGGFQARRKMTLAP